MDRPAWQGRYPALGTLGPCPVCDSRYTLYVQDVLGSRTRTKIQQNFCMSCSSLFNFGSYEEDEKAFRDNAEYLKRQKDIDAPIFAQLANEVITRHRGNIKTALDVGCGIGLFVKALEQYGICARGCDLNPYTAAYAREVVGINCVSEPLERDQGRYDLISSIQVFEHLREPRVLFKQMLDRLNPGGSIYISVPFVDREHWHHLWGASGRTEFTPSDPFHDNDVHIVHFSRRGLETMGKDFGAKSAEYWVSTNLSRRDSLDAYPGILFKF